MRRWRSNRGVALVESALVLPLVLLLSVSVFEFGRAFQSWMVLTNASREGARLAAMPSGNPTDAEGRVRQYMQSGQLSGHASAPVSVDRSATIMVNGVPESASLVAIDYPFNFIMLQPVAQLVVAGSLTGAPLTIHAESVMRNEAP